jgi:hypothetical protein
MPPALPGGRGHELASHSPTACSLDDTLVAEQPGIQRPATRLRHITAPNHRDRENLWSGLMTVEMRGTSPETPVHRATRTPGGPAGSLETGGHRSARANDTHRQSLRLRQSLRSPDPVLLRCTRLRPEPRSPRRAVLLVSRPGRGSGYWRLQRVRGEPIHAAC